MAEDWADRSNLADVMPRGRPAGFGQPAGQSGFLAPGSAYQPGGAVDDQGNPVPGNGVTLGDLTNPAPRPVVFQVALNFSLNVGLNAGPLSDKTFPCDGVVIGVPSGGTTVMFGYGSGITVSSGIPILANQPVEFMTDNMREIWELQRCMEALVALVGGGSLGKYRAPRVVMDLNRYYLVTSVAVQTVACMALYVPEGQ